jgi:hypothetical protein
VAIVTTLLFLVQYVCKQKKYCSLEIKLLYLLVLATVASSTCRALAS